MDVSESFDQQQHPQAAAAAADQQMQMQCEPSYPPTTFMPPTSALPPGASTTNGFCTALIPMPEAPPCPFGPVGHAIPLPAPPLKTAVMQANQSQQQPQQQQQSVTDVEIDSVLLQQFSCLGTTDHEDLVNQFQSLMNNKVDKEAARFYLEMSNWNLQTAVGYYLDFYTFQTLPSMKIVQQSRPRENQYVWRLQNDGTVDWPNGCYLSSPSQKRSIEVPALKPGETCDIVAEIPPTQPAIMWRLCTPNGWNVGEPIWMMPTGTADSQAELSERMSQLLMSSETTNPESCPQVNIVISVNME